MATISAYGGVRSIGNEFVTSRTKQQPHIDSVRRHFIAAQQRVQPVVAPVQHAAEVVPQQPEPSQQFEQYDPIDQYPQVEQFQEAESYYAQAAAIERPRFQLPVLTLPTVSRRVVIITLSSIAAVGIIALAIPRMGEAASLTTSGVSQIITSVNDKIKPANAQASFTMPAHSVLVKNSITTSYLDSVEGQAITINIGNSAVNPLPTDIANWVNTSNGPERGTTLLSVNASNVSAYVASAVQKQSSTPGAASVNTASESAAVNQIVSELLKYNGVTVNISSDSSNN